MRPDTQVVAIIEHVDYPFGQARTPPSPSRPTNERRQPETTFSLPTYNDVSHPRVIILSCFPLVRMLENRTESPCPHPHQSVLVDVGIALASPIVTRNYV